MIKFDKNDVLRLYKMIVDYTGGTFGIRDETMLESAIMAPYQTFGGEELYPTIMSKAARLGYGLVKNHPFIDGKVWSFTSVSSTCRRPCCAATGQTPLCCVWIGTLAVAPH